VGLLQRRQAAEAGLDLLDPLGRGEDQFGGSTEGIGERRLHGVPAPDPVVGRRLRTPPGASGKMPVRPPVAPPAGVVAFGVRGQYKTRSKLGPRTGYRLWDHALGRS